MIRKQNESLVLLTYKEKILLMIRNYVFNSGLQKTWSMIGGKNEINESNEKTIVRKIKEDMNIKIKDVKFLLTSFSEDKDISFYYSKLTDDNVNFIERSDGQELQFFNLRELNKLQLTTSADRFFTQNKAIIENLLSN